MKKYKHSFRLIKLFVVMSVAVIALFYAVFYAALFTDPGRSFLSNVLTTALKKEGLSAELGDVSGQAPSRLNLSSFVLADSTRKIVEMKGIELEWNPFYLLKGEFHINRLSVAHINVGKQPAPATEKALTLPAMPLLPLGLVIEKGELKSVNLTSLIASDARTQHVVNVKGTALRYGVFSESWSGELSVLEVGADKSSVKINKGHPKLGSDSPVTVILSDGGTGVLAALVDESKPFSFTLNAKGRQSEWSGHLTSHIEGRVSVDGDFNVSPDRRTENPLIDCDLNFDYQKLTKDFWQRVIRDKMHAKGRFVLKSDTLILRLCEISSSFFKLTFEGNNLLTEKTILGAGKLDFVSLAPVYFGSNFAYEGHSEAEVTLTGGWDKLALNLDGNLRFKNQGPVDAFDGKLKAMLTLNNFLSAANTLDFKAELETVSHSSNLPYSLDQAKIKGVGRYMMAPDHTHFEKLAFSSPDLDLTGHASLRLGDLETCSLKGNLKDVSGLANTLDIPFSGPARIALTQERLDDDFLVSLSGEDFKSDTHKLDPMVINAAFPKTQGINIGIDYGSEDRQLFVSTQFSDQEKRFVFKDIKLWDNSSEVKGHLDFNKITKRYQGFLKGEIKTIDPLLRLIDSQKGAGKLELDCKFIPTKKATNVKALIKIRDLVTDEARLKLGVVNTAFDYAADLPLKGNLGTALYTGEYQEYSFSEFISDAKGQANDAAFDFTVKSLMPMAASVKSSGRYQRKDGKHLLELSRFKGRLNERQTDLIQPLTAAWGEDVFALNDLNLKVGVGFVKGHIKRDSQQSDVGLKVTNFPLAMARLIDPDLNVDGGLTGEISYKGPHAGPQGEFVLSSQDLDFSMYDEADAKVKTKLTGTLLQNVMSLEGHFYQGGNQKMPLDITADIAVDFNTFWPSLNSEKPLKIGAKGKVSLADVMFLWPFENDELQGVVDLDVQLQMLKDALDFKGRATLAKGYYENAEFGTELDQLSFSLEGLGQSVALSDFSARSQKGKISGQGEIKLSESYPYFLNLKVDNYPLIMNDDMEIEGGGTLRVDGDAKRQDRITGSLDVKRAVYNLPQDFSSELNDIFDLDKGQDLSHLSAQTKLDIDVNFTRPLLVKGWGVESTWRGNLAFKGTLNDPALVGNLKATQGEFKLFGPIFKLTQGDVIFAKSTKMIPTLSIKAETKNEEIKAIISVTGVATAPKISLSSEPDLPQDEILSQMLFSEGTANLSPYQALKIAGLIGKFNGTPIPLIGQLESISSALGFDSFEIDSAKEGGAAPIVKFGKRITSNVRATVEENVEEQKASGKLQVELTPNIMLESGINTESEGNIGLVGKWEY